MNNGDSKNDMPPTDAEPAFCVLPGALSAAAADTSNPPHVSVLMPTFRQAAFIRRALESLRAQTFTSWELIIVDDNSPDETACNCKTISR